MGARYPDFVVIGAAKSGTTTLYAYLASHPELFLSTPKEPEFFARDDVHARGLAWYASLFADARPDQRCGEASTLYTLSPHFPKAAERMHAVIPRARLLYVVRDPVERAYSYYVQLVKNYQNATKDYRVNRTFEECVFPEAHPDRAGRELFFAPFDAHLPDVPGLFVDGSRYRQQLDAYRRFFPEEQIEVVRFSDLTRDPAAVLRDVCTFLGVDPGFDFLEGGEVEVNVAARHFEDVGRTALARRLKRSPLVRAAMPLVPRAVRGKVLTRAASIVAAGGRPAAQPPSPLLPETRAYLERALEGELEGVV